MLSTDRSMQTASNGYFLEKVKEREGEERDGERTVYRELYRVGALWSVGRWPTAVCSIKLLPLCDWPCPVTAGRARTSIQRDGSALVWSGGHLGSAARGRLPMDSGPPPSSSSSWATTQTDRPGSGCGTSAVFARNTIEAENKRVNKWADERTERFIDETIGAVLLTHKTKHRFGCDVTSEWCMLMTHNA